MFESPVIDCESDPEEGNCKAYMRRWFFNVTSSRCEKFIYGGCPGNANNYFTKELCQKTCKSKDVVLTAMDFYPSICQSIGIRCFLTVAVAHPK